MKILTCGDELPTQAGGITFRWRGGAESSCEGHELTLDPAGVTLVSLKAGRQFALFTADRRAFFGGRDEQEAFLTEVKHEVKSLLLRGGEAAFYGWLKPVAIHKLEEVLGYAAERQGDVFAMAIPHIKEADFDKIGSLACDFQSGERIALFGTRHTLNGQLYGRMNVRLPGCSPTKFYPVVKGVVSAPDHSPLRLAGRHHMLARAHGLVESRENRPS